MAMTADKSGKTDMERVGLFMELGYVTIGDKYKTGKFYFNEPATRGKQILPGGSKVNSALQHGYFDVKFNRIFESEGFSDPVSLRRRYRIQEKKKDIGKPFLPASGPKMMCGLGNYYGCIGSGVSSFSPLLKSTKTAPQPVYKNVQTNPCKHGTGYGYANVMLSPYPSHAVDPFSAAKERMQAEVKLHKVICKGGPFRLNIYPEDYFNLNPYRIDKALPPTRKEKVKPVKDLDLKPFKPSSPSKRSGGGMFGTFDPYPSHSEDLYIDKKKRPINVKNSSGRQYGPHPGPKTRPVNSIQAQNVLRAMNVTNYRTMTAVP